MAPRSCPHATSCEMYGLLKLSGTLNAWKINYCNGDYERCERYRLAALGRPVPVNLMPNGALLKGTSSANLKAVKAIK
ncbi:MAG: hypothetical protein ACRENE_11565 [Polyangiaceae bacterium]